MTTNVETYNELLGILKADPVFNEKPFPADFAAAVYQEFDDFQSGKPGRYNDAAVYKGSGLPGAFMAVADAWQSAIGFDETTHSRLWDVFAEWRTYVATNPAALTTPITNQETSGSGFFNQVFTWVKQNPLITGAIAAGIYFYFVDENKKQ